MLKGNLTLALLSQATARTLRGRHQPGAPPCVPATFSSGKAAAMLPDPSWRVGILGGSAKGLATVAPAAYVRSKAASCAASPSSTAACTARHDMRGHVSMGSRNFNSGASVLELARHPVSTAAALGVSAPDVITSDAPNSAAAVASEPSPKAADMAARLRIGFRMEAARGYGNVRGAQQLSEFATDTFLELLHTQVRPNGRAPFSFALCPAPLVTLRGFRRWPWSAGVQLAHFWAARALPTPFRRDMLEALKTSRGAWLRN